MKIIQDGSQEIKQSFVQEEQSQHDFIQSLLKNNHQKAKSRSSFADGEHQSQQDFIQTLLANKKSSEAAIPQLIVEDVHTCHYQKFKLCQSCFKYKLSAKKKKNVEFKHCQIGDTISIAFQFDLSNEELCYLEKTKPRVLFYQVKTHRYLGLETISQTFKSAFVLQFRIKRLPSRFKKTVSYAEITETLVAQFPKKVNDFVSQFCSEDILIGSKITLKGLSSRVLKLKMRLNTRLKNGDRIQIHCEAEHLQIKNVNDIVLLLDEAKGRLRTFIMVENASQFEIKLRKKQVFGTVTKLK